MILFYHKFNLVEGVKNENCFICITSYVFEYELYRYLRIFISPYTCWEVSMKTIIDYTLRLLKPKFMFLYSILTIHRTTYNLVVGSTVLSTHTIQEEKQIFKFENPEAEADVN